MAKLHALPVDWYDALKDTFLKRDPAIAAILKDAPDYAPCWCLPWTGLDTGMPVLGVGNPNAETAKKILSLELETGVFEKIMLHPAFQPTSEAARRQVVVHNDFKPDNVLRDPESGALTAIDYDLVQVGPAVMDFGLPYMMWLGARFTTFEFRQTFIRDYLNAAGLPSADADVRAMMLDCEVNTIVAFPGLLSNIYDAEVPLLRGVKHPTAKAGVEAGSPDDSPTGLELVDLLAEAIQKVRVDEALIDRALRDGLVVTLFNTEGLGSAPLYSWLKEIQKHRMLRLLGLPRPMVVRFSSPTTRRNNALLPCPALNLPTVRETALPKDEKLGLAVKFATLVIHPGDGIHTAVEKEVVPKAYLNPGGDKGCREDVVAHARHHQHRAHHIHIDRIAHQIAFPTQRRGVERNQRAHPRVKLVVFVGPEGARIADQAAPNFVTQKAYREVVYMFWWREHRQLVFSVRNTGEQKQRIRTPLSKRISYPFPRAFIT